MKSNPWVAPYLIGGGPNRYAHIERHAVAQRIDGQSVVARAEVLKAAMKNVFLCGEQASLLLDELLGIGEGHARNNFGSSQQMIGAMYSLQPWGETQSARMLTGLAGTGKTQLVQAMKRFFLDRSGGVELAGHGKFLSQPAWFMSLKEGSSLNSLLAPYLNAEIAGVEGKGLPKKSLSQPHLLQLASRVSRRDGVCMIFVDEFQFITKSDQANSLAMSLLLQLISLGPRVVYVANFSLARRMRRRRPEDRHRVLPDPLELLPDASDSADFRNYIVELTRVAPDDFKFEVSEVTGLLHRYTFGIKRAVVDLMVGAWAHAKSNRGGRADVTESDMKSAYASSGYLAHRNDVEALWRHSVGGKDIDPDLLNPLRVEDLAGNVVVAQSAIDNFNQRVNERHVESMLTPSERDALAKLAPPKKTKTAGGKVRPLRPGAATKQALLDAFEHVAKDL